MFYTEFINKISYLFVDIPLDHMKKLWEVYQEKLRDNRGNLYEYEKILLDQIIYAYAYVKNSTLDDYGELINQMMRIYTRIYSYPITYFDDKWIKNVKKDEEGFLLEDQIDSKIFDCLHDYMDEVLQIRKENYYEAYDIERVYEHEFSYTISHPLTLEKRQKCIKSWMEMYHQLCEEVRDVPRYVIKNSILHSYDNLFDITGENRLSIAFGLCQMKNISSYEEAILYLEKIYQNDEFLQYQNEYFCYGLLECIDWKYSECFKKSTDNFIKGVSYFKETEADDDLLVIAKNMNDAWHDLSIEKVTWDFVTGLLYRGYRMLLKNGFLEDLYDQNEKTLMWYEEIFSLVTENVEDEIIVVEKLYQELIDNPTVEQDLENSSTVIKQSIISSYKRFSGHISYEERCNLVVAILYMEKQIVPLEYNQLSIDEIIKIIQTTVDCYKKSNFLNSQYKNKQVEKYLYENIWNYYTCSYSSQQEQNLFDEIHLLIQSVCKTKDEINSEIKMIDDIYEKLYCISEEASWNVTRGEILQSLYNSYTTILIENGDLLTYDHRFNLTFGFLCSRYASSDIHELSRGIQRIVVGDVTQDTYFIYGMIVNALSGYRYEEGLELNEVIQAGIHYSISSAESNIIWTIAESINDYTHDLMHSKKEVDFIIGIIYGTYKKSLQPSKQLIKNYIEFN